MTRARRAIIAIGRSGNHRQLGVPGEEDPDKVFNRLYDPKEFVGQQVLVVGGGDSALETAIALASAGAHVTLSYRKKEFARPKPENVENDPDAREEPVSPGRRREPDVGAGHDLHGRLHGGSGESPARLGPAGARDAGRTDRGTAASS